MQTQMTDLDVDATFFNLVANIEELEELTAPGWFSWNWFAVGTIVAEGIVTGIALT